MMTGLGERERGDVEDRDISEVVDVKKEKKTKVVGTRPQL